MSRAEAEYDGIEMIDDPHKGYRGCRGAYIYKVSCEKCGRKITKTQYRRDVVYLCDYCKGLIKKEKTACIVRRNTIYRNKERKAI